jgi:hypothetical protein
MGDRVLSALYALGGEGTPAQVRAQAEADWQRPLVQSQVTVALTRLSRMNPPRVTLHPAPGGGWAWRAAQGGAPCLGGGLTAGSRRAGDCGPGSG